MQTTEISEPPRSRQVLIGICKRINFGSILNVRVTDGDICCDAVRRSPLVSAWTATVAERPEIDLRVFAFAR